MKKLVLLTLLAACLGISARAQVHVGITGGAQMATQMISGIDADLGSVRPIVGFRAGVMLNAPLIDGLSVRPQVLYSVKGFKATYFNVADASAKINYLEVPVQLVYGFDAGPGWLTIGAGPYVGYALNGKTTISIQGGEPESEPITFGSGEDADFKRLDVGLTGSVGYDLPSGLSVNLYVAPGFVNLSNTPEVKARNFTFGVSLGYWFGADR